LPDPLLTTRDFPRFVLDAFAIRFFCFIADLSDRPYDDQEIRDRPTDRRLPLPRCNEIDLTFAHFAARRFPLDQIVDPAVSVEPIERLPELQHGAARLDHRIVHIGLIAVRAVDEVAPH
jgi:hypothetical protein